MCSSFEENYRVRCPAGANSWCTYQLDIANNTHLHKHGKGLPKEAIKHIKPIFARLSADELLGKCLHGKTQNQNESYNSLIWKRTPKDKFVKLTTFEIAVYDSAAHFNVVSLATLLTYDSVDNDRGYYTTQGCVDIDRGYYTTQGCVDNDRGYYTTQGCVDIDRGYYTTQGCVDIDRGYYTTQGCIDDNEYRIKNAKRQSTAFIKTRRRYLRGKKKSKGDKTKKAECKVYAPGSF